MSSDVDLWERLSLPWKIVAGVVVVGGVAGLVFGSEWWNIAKSHASPHRFDGVFKAPRADGNDAVVAITTVTVDASAETVAHWSQWFVTVIDASTGEVLVEHEWPERHDRPACHPSGPGRLACSSKETGLATYDLESMQAVDEPALGESAPAKPNTCRSRVAEVAGVSFSFQRVQQTQAKSLDIEPRTAPSAKCPDGLIEPEFICDTETDKHMVLDDTPAVIVTDEASLIQDRKKLVVMAVDDACKERWRHEVPTAAKLTYQTRIDDLVVLAVTPNQRSEEHRAALVALDVKSGAERWRHEI